MQKKTIEKFYRDRSDDIEQKKILTIISDKEYIQMLEKIKLSYQDGQLKVSSFR